MSESNFGDRISFFKKVTFRIIRVTSLLCLPMLFLWIFGTPGTPQNAYARGWNLGFQTLYQYFLGGCSLMIIYLIAEKISQRFSALLYVNLVFISISWIFLVYSAFNLSRAFQIMFSG
ncbi:MAG: hypothetical protein ACTS3T_21370 [Almyronema sp.]